MWPDPLSISWVDVNDIQLKLDTPNMDRRQHHMFNDNDIEKWKTVVVIRSTSTIVMIIFESPE